MEPVPEEGVVVPDLDDTIQYNIAAQHQNITQSVVDKVLENVEAAQERQKVSFARRRNKGVKSFHLGIGDLVLKKVMKNVGRKGGKMDAKWTGPYKIISIDSNQRIELADIRTQIPLQRKVPYCQVKPVKTSELHQCNIDTPTTDSSTRTTTETSTRTTTETSTWTTTEPSTQTTIEPSTRTTTETSTRTTTETSTRTTTEPSTQTTTEPSTRTTTNSSTQTTTEPST